MKKRASKMIPKFKKRKVFESGAEATILHMHDADKLFKRMGKTAFNVAFPTGVAVVAGYGTHKAISAAEKKLKEEKAKRLEKQGKPVPPELTHPAPETEAHESLVTLIHGIQRNQSRKMFHELEDVRNLYTEPRDFLKSEKTKAVAKGVVRGTGHVLSGAGKALAGTGRLVGGAGKALLGRKNKVTHIDQKTVIHPSAQVAPSAPSTGPSAAPSPTVLPSGMPVKPPVQPPPSPRQPPVMYSSDPIENMTMGGGYGYRSESMEIDYSVIGKIILSYFNNVFDVLSQIMDSLKGSKTKLSDDNLKFSKIKDILTRGILDYKNPTSYEEMLAQLDRVRMEHDIKHESFKSKRNQMTEDYRIHLSAAMNVITMISSIGAGLMALYQVSKIVKEMRENKKQLNVMLASNKKLDAVFKGYIIPDLINIMTEVLEGKVKTKQLLAVKMHRVLESVGRNFPSLVSSTRSWYPEVEG